MRRLLVKQHHEFDVAPEQPSKHAVHLQERAVQVERLHLDDLLACKGEQLLGQLGRALAGFQDLVDILANGRPLRQRIVGEG